MVFAWRYMRNSYRAYSLIIIRVAFGYHTGMLVSTPYMGLPRHLLLAFPVFIGLSTMYFELCFVEVLQ